MELRYYQKECISEIIRTVNQDKIYRQAIVMATGCGKTEMKVGSAAGDLPSAYGRGCESLKLEVLTTRPSILTSY